MEFIEVWDKKDLLKADKDYLKNIYKQCNKEHWNLIKLYPIVVENYNLYWSPLPIQKMDYETYAILSGDNLPSYDTDDSLSYNSYVTKTIEDGLESFYNNRFKGRYVVDKIKGFLQCYMRLIHTVRYTKLTLEEQELENDKAKDFYQRLREQSEKDSKLTGQAKIDREKEKIEKRIMLNLNYLNSRGVKVDEELFRLNILKQCYQLGYDSVSNAVKELNRLDKELVFG